MRLNEEVRRLLQEPSSGFFEISALMQKRISDLTNFVSNRIFTAGEIFATMVSEIRQVQEKGATTGVPSGLANLDAITGGLQPGNLIVLAARPGAGKTVKGLHLAKHPAFTLNIPVAFFSLEMTAAELVGRLAASESNICSTLINQKKINPYQLQALGASCARLIDAPLYIDDTAGLSILDVRARAKKLYHENGVRLIIVDYLQLMSGTGASKGNREQEIAEISRGLKALAKELNIPVVALSQLSRKCEERADRRPILSDLRESGSIEQDADIVAFLFRPEMYGLFQNGYTYGQQVLETNNLMLVDIAKGRGLRTGEIPLKFFGEFMKIENYDL
jgi:replicative DNA helicase